MAASIIKRKQDDEQGEQPSTDKSQEIAVSSKI
jgi:hypothetical protein